MSITLGLYTYNINFWFLKLGLLEPCNMSRQWNRIVISDFDPYTYIIVSFISILISYFCNASNISLLKPFYGHSVIYDRLTQQDGFLTINNKFKFGLHIGDGITNTDSLIGLNAYKFNFERSEWQTPSKMGEREREITKKEKKKRERERERERCMK